MITSQPERVIPALVAGADRRRRTRAAALQAARLAPAIAAALLVVAVIARFAGWSRIWAIAGLVIAAASLLAYSWLARRPRASSDAIALQVDEDAGLGGELRSAHWFSSKEEKPDEWVEFHLQSAASRAEQVDWVALYPPVKAARAWSLSGLMAAAAVVLSIVLPARPAGAVADRAAIDQVTAAVNAALPSMTPEMQKELEALLAALKNGSITMADMKMALESLQAKNAMDPALQQKLNDLAKLRDQGKAPGKSAKGPDAEMPKNASEAAGMPEESRWAQDDQAARDASANANRQTNDKNPSASEQSGQKGVGSAQAETSQANATQASMQMVREAATASDAGQMMMMNGGGGQSGDPRTGQGGRGAGDKTGAEVLKLAEGLRKELLEANSDTPGDNVNKDDLRRKTEQGKSAIGYSGARPSVTFDPSHATAPPPVPEARRSLVQSYFVRKSP